MIFELKFACKMLRALLTDRTVDYIRAYLDTCVSVVTNGMLFRVEKSLVCREKRSHLRKTLVYIPVST